MRTETTLSALIAALTSNCGDMFDACKKCMVSPMFVHNWRKDDKDVDQQLLEAERVGSLALQSEAIRRATEGVEKGVWYQGEQVGTETQYSDSLLTTLLKAKVAGFNKDGEGGILSGANLAGSNVQINIMPRAASYEEWLQMKQSTLAKPAEALPAPDTAIEAEYTEVSEAAQAAYSIMRNPLEGLGI